MTSISIDLFCGPSLRMAYTSPQAFVFYYYFLHAFESIKSVKSVVAGKAGNSDAALADISFSCSFSFRSLNLQVSNTFTVELVIIFLDRKHSRMRRTLQA